MAERSSSAVFPTPLKTICSGAKPGCQRPGQLTGGDDVSPRTQLPQHPENREIAVGLDRKADPMRQRSQGRVQRAVAAADRLGVIHVGRCTNLLPLSQRATRRRK